MRLGIYDSFGNMAHFYLLNIHHYTAVFTEFSTIRFFMLNSALLSELQQLNSTLFNKVAEFSTIQRFSINSALIGGLTEFSTI